MHTFTTTFISFDSIDGVARSYFLAAPCGQGTFAGYTIVGARVWAITAPALVNDDGTAMLPPPSYWDWHRVQSTPAFSNIPFIKINISLLSCADCGAPLYPGARIAMPEHGRIVCGECWDTAYRVCHQCGTAIPLADAMHAGIGRWYCPDCGVEMLTACEQCGALIDRDDALTDPDGYLYCADCWHDRFTLCRDCGDVVSLDHALTIYNGSSVCESCADDYYYCRSCDEYFPEHRGTFRDDEFYCDDCGAPSQHRRLRRYGYKPDWRFRWTEAEDNDDTHVFLGIELEGDCPDIDDRNLSLDQLDRHQPDERDWCAKEDGSVDEGYELVSSPRTLAHWHEQGLSELSDFLKDVERYHCYQPDHNGLHVHVTSVGMSLAHKVRFNAFVYSISEFLPEIAGRDETEWARFYGRKAENGNALLRFTNDSRYSAVNWQNDRTVELRLFAATNDVAHIRRVLEFCHAAYQFTKYAGVMQIYGRQEAFILSEFYEFIRYDARYTALASWLGERVQQQPMRAAA